MKKITLFCCCFYILNMVQYRQQKNTDEVIDEASELMAVAKMIQKGMILQQQQNEQETIKETVSNSADASKSEKDQKPPQYTRDTKFNGNIVVKETIFVENTAQIQNMLVDGTVKVQKDIDTINLHSTNVDSELFKVQKIISGELGLIIKGDVFVGKIYNDNQNSKDNSRSITGSSFIMEEEKTWTSHSMEYFDKPDNIDKSWNYNKTNKCNQLNNYFLGGHCLLSYESITKLQNDLPTHKKLKIKATFHMFDNWDGEEAFMIVDNEKIWSKSGIQSSFKAPSICGNEEFSDSNTNILIDNVINHTANILNITFGTTLTKQPCDASYAVDNLEIYYV